jgi:hypothetical protein
MLAAGLPGMHEARRPDAGAWDGLPCMIAAHGPRWPERSALGNMQCIDTLEKAQFFVCIEINRLQFLQIYHTL